MPTLEQVHESIAALEQLFRRSRDPETVFLLKQMSIHMSQLSDAVAANNAAVAALQTSVNTAIAKIEALPGPPSDAGDVADAVTALSQSTSTLTSAAASLDAANPPTAQ